MWARSTCARMIFISGRPCTDRGPEMRSASPFQNGLPFKTARTFQPATCQTCCQASCSSPRGRMGSGGRSRFRACWSQPWPVRGRRSRDCRPGSRMVRRRGLGPVARVPGGYPAWGRPGASVGCGRNPWGGSPSPRWHGFAARLLAERAMRGLLLPPEWRPDGLSCPIRSLSGDGTRPGECAWAKFL